MAEPGAAHLSIGEVLGLLLEEFPDVTISKIRFLESQGLIEPERTPSGYRKFFDDDVELLRVILREQRENFLPLRVIKDRIDSGEIEHRRPDAAAGHDRRRRRRRTPPSSRPGRRSPAPGGRRPTAPSGRAADAAADAAGRRRAARAAGAGQRSRRPAAARACSSTATSCARWRRSRRDQLAQLEEYGVVAEARRGGDLYGEDAVEIAAAAGGFLRAGVDARHLRAWRTSVEREAGLYEQLILPMLRQRNPQARSQAAAPARRARRPRRPAARGDDARRPAPVPRLTGRRRPLPIARRRGTAARYDRRRGAAGARRGPGRGARPTRRWSCCASRPGASACCRSTSARRRRRRSTTPSRASTPPRPLTHDLFVQTLHRARRLAASRSSSPRCATTPTSPSCTCAAPRATLTVLSSRPSDAIALAVRCEAPLFASEELLDEVGQEPTAGARGGGRGDHRRVPRLHRARQPRRLRAR